MIQIGNMHNSPFRERLGSMNREKATTRPRFAFYCDLWHAGFFIAPLFYAPLFLVFLASV